MQVITQSCKALFITRQRPQAPDHPHLNIHNSLAHNHTNNMVDQRDRNFFPPWWTAIHFVFQHGCHCYGIAMVKMSVQGVYSAYQVSRWMFPNWSITMNSAALASIWESSFSLQYCLHHLIRGGLNGEERDLYTNTLHTSSVHIVKCTIYRLEGASKCHGYQKAITMCTKLIMKIWRGRN